MKFGSKLMYLDYLHELAQHIPLNQLIIPPAIRKSVSTLPSSALLLKKGKVFPYSLPSVGPGADPGVQAVSPQVT